jgi:predicted SAM-dependent methyltransferase
VVHDLRHGLPLDPATVDLIYSEHVLEHLDLATGMRILGDARRALKPGGVLRIAMPDLGYVVERYLNDWRDQQWLQDPGFAWIDTPARMLNTCVREWGHLYLYDAAELTLRLSQVGFATTRQCEWSRSDVPELRGLETRPDSLLVFEAVA